MAGATLMQQRRGTAAEWAAVNPILAAGEIGVETDTGILKVGDGTTRWLTLVSPYLPVSGGTMKGSTAAQIPLTIQGNANQTADLFRVADVDGAVLGGIDSKGYYYLSGSDRALAKGDILTARAADKFARLPLGTNGQILMADSSMAGGVKWASSKAPVDIQVFSASATWTKPNGAKLIEVIVISAGGSGAADYIPNSPFTAPGGSGGGYGRWVVPADALSATVSVTVGAGGTAVTANTSVSTRVPGVDGGQSSFGRMVVTGGKGGVTYNGSGNVVSPMTPGAPVGSGSLIISNSSYTFFKVSPFAGGAAGIVGLADAAFGGGGGGSIYVASTSQPSTYAAGTAPGATGTGLGAPGGAANYTQTSGASTSATAGTAPGGGGGSAVFAGVGGSATSGAGARGEVIVITHF